ncbi:MAG: hypothetical protein HY720_22155 [Planctomycetes bacterium]|nr:hypothetical protein [Planctomycetota bacterium]
MRHPSILGLLAALVLTLAGQAEGYPGFARKYRTSCSTCHVAYPKLNDFGEAFRLNGYQIPDDDEFYVKEEPVELGVESYKEVWPKAIWPNTIPGTAPFSLRLIQELSWREDRTRSDADWQFGLPTELELTGAANLGPDIAAWATLAFEPNTSRITDEGIAETPGAATPDAGGHSHLPERDLEVELHRAFVNFGSLFSEGSGVLDLGLPREAVNLRVGALDPSFLAFSNHRRLTSAGYNINNFTFNDNHVRFESPFLPAIELHGILASRFRYALGWTTGGRQILDHKPQDFYGRIAYKVGGMALDGTGGAGGAEGDELASTDNWVDNSFTLGLFGYYGKQDLIDTLRSTITVVEMEENEDGEMETMIEIEPVTIPVDWEDRFFRVGTDARLNWGNLDLFGAVMWAADKLPRENELTRYTVHDEQLFRVGGESPGWDYAYAGMLEADYVIYPWMIAITRYEFTNYEGRTNGNDVHRIIPNLTFLLRANVKAYIEGQLTYTDEDSTTGNSRWEGHRFLLGLDVSF